MDWNALRAEFPRADVDWRAQTLSKDGSKAMALAYIDARAVMDRLDDVCGPENWQDSYVETGKGRVLCTLSIRVGGEWIAKTDGSGDSDIEGEKGAISGALKRAAVRWGIGRYLYDMPSPWVPCESYEAGGKKRWKKWAADPWAYVTAPRHEQTPQGFRFDAEHAAKEARATTDAAMIIHEIEGCQSAQSLMDLWTRCASDMTLKPLLKRRDVVKAKDDAKARLSGPDPFGEAA